MVPFGEYLPDLPAYANPGSTVAKNVLPGPNSYLPFKALAPFSDSLALRCQGGISARNKADNVYVYAATAAKLYVLADMGWTEVTRSAGGDYDTKSTDWWEFAQWDEKIIGVNGGDSSDGDTPQIITLGAANFAALSGTPPKARHIGVVRDFIVLGNTYDASDGAVPNRVRWSGIGDETAWTISVSTQADKEDLKGEGGWVQKIVGGEYGIVFQERSIWRMSYVGSPVVWQFDEILKGRGTPAPQSVTRIGDLVFYLGLDGFEVVLNGSQVQPIGHNKVDRTFWADLDAENLHRVVGASDPVNKRVFWAYPAAGNTGGRPNRILIYDWVNAQWSYAEVDTEYLMSAATTGYTLDGLDSITTDLDALPESLDSRVWAGGVNEMAAFDCDHKLGFFTGTPLAPTVETAEIALSEAQGISGQRAFVRAARPLMDGASGVTVAVAGRNTLSDAATFGSVRSVSEGRAAMRSNARYHRFRVSAAAADWSHAQGLEVEYTAVGER